MLEEKSSIKDIASYFTITVVNVINSMIIEHILQCDQKHVLFIRTIFQ